MRFQFQQYLTRKSSKYYQSSIYLTNNIEQLSLKTKNGFYLLFVFN